MPYVYSTATCAGTYVDYGPTEPNSKQHAVARRKVTIHGGHGVAHPTRGPIQGHIHTPRGVVTEVSDEDLEFLMQDKNFQRHMAAGFMRVEKKKYETEKMAADMAEKDGSAPLTPKDFEKSENSEPGSDIYKKKEINMGETMQPPVRQKSKGKR